MALAGEDIIAQAPTGTGKTISFAIPILEKIDPQKEAVQTIILSPTRELAVQIAEEMKEVAYYQKEVRILAVYGGEYIERQISALKARPQIIVATPGRLLDHLRRRTIRLNDVATVVLDEADEMLNMGFKEDIDTILESITSEHQTLLLSATISKEIEGIAKTYLKNPKTVRINKQELTVPQTEQYYILTKEKDKIEIISRIVDLNAYHLVMVFCNTKKAVDDVSSQLMQRGFLVEALHGDMKQMQRDRVMKRFRAAQINLLVASDVAARGLDIDDVDVVFNYDVPTDEEYYVHRIGRTGRANRRGLAITLVTRSERQRLSFISKYAKANITAMSVPSLESVIRVRIERILAQAMESADRPLAGQYQSQISKALSSVTDYDPEKIITGLIMSELENLASSNEISEEKEEVTRTRKKQKDVRIFITLGKKDVMKAANLVQIIRRMTDLTNEDINRVEIYDTFSFFEVPSAAAEKVLAAFSREKINGRRVTVEIAKEKRKRS
ncbi:MAG: DEAD/DEAH box helicase [Acholeplasmataceae bacterium]|nr:DEAD/DEAH box helicase [Acholeplasmataceae bacterium]